jgi:ferrochelatase
MTTDGVLLLAHGTIRDPSELPTFLRRIRRGREPSEALLEEMRHRYDAIGGSPLLALTEAQAFALGQRLGIHCYVAMRLSSPTVEEVLPLAAADGVERLCLLPLAPFSVDVYNSAAIAARDSLEGPARAIEFAGVSPWGETPDFVAAQAELIREHVQDADIPLILTAHSLPMVAIRAGDGYAAEAAACAAAISTELGRSATLAFQSEGADGGEWLGPSLAEVLSGCARAGASRVAIAPFGFLTEHVETLYDLDIETRARAISLGLELIRVPALDARPAFIEALAKLVEQRLCRSCA